VPPEPTRVRRQLAAELAHLRSIAGLSLRTVGDAVGIGHAQVRRIELATATPSSVQARTWLRATGADEDTTERVLALLEAAHVETAPWADLLASSTGRHLNAIAAAREEAATLNCSYQQFIVPGLAQTSAYVRALIPHLRVAIDPEADLPARIARQEVLHQAGREFRFVLTRRALSWNPDPATVSMEGQLDRLRELDRLPTVSVRVLDDDAAPMGGYSSFTIYDRQADGGALVAVELEHHVLTITAADDVEHYRRRFVDLYEAGRPLSAD